MMFLYHLLTAEPYGTFGMRGGWQLLIMTIAKVIIAISCQSWFRDYLRWIERTVNGFFDRRGWLMPHPNRIARQSVGK